MVRHQHVWNMHVNLVLLDSGFPSVQVVVSRDYNKVWHHNADFVTNVI